MIRAGGFGQIRMTRPNEMPRADLALTAQQLRALQRLWPNRAHESNWLKAAVCKLGLHRWYEIKMPGHQPPLSCLYCRWCPEVKVRVAEQ